MTQVTMSSNQVASVPYSWRTGLRLQNISTRFRASDTSNKGFSFGPVSSGTTYETGTIDLQCLIRLQVDPVRLTLFATPFVERSFAVLFFALLICRLGFSGGDRYFRSGCERWMISEGMCSPKRCWTCKTVSITSPAARTKLRWFRMLFERVFQVSWQSEHGNLSRQHAVVTCRDHKSWPSWLCFWL